MTAGEPGPPPSSPLNDPETQPERTRLAWRRTTLAFAVLVLLTWRGAVTRGSPLGVLAAGLVTGVWVAFIGTAHRRVRLLGGRRPPSLAASIALGTAGALVLTVLLAGLLIVPGV